MNHYASSLTMKTLTFILSLRERKKNLFPLPLGEGKGEGIFLSRWSIFGEIQSEEEDDERYAVALCARRGDVLESAYLFGNLILKQWCFFKLDYLATTLTRPQAVHPKRIEARQQ